MHTRRTCTGSRQRVLIVKTGSRELKTWRTPAPLCGTQRAGLGRNTNWTWSHSGLWICFLRTAPLSNGRERGGCFERFRHRLVPVLGAQRRGYTTTLEVTNRRRPTDTNLVLRRHLVLHLSELKSRIPLPCSRQKSKKNNLSPKLSGTHNQDTIIWAYTQNLSFSKPHHHDQPTVIGPFTFMSKDRSDRQAGLLIWPSTQKF